jgi:hypothetical protein
VVAISHLIFVTNFQLKTIGKSILQETVKIPEILVIGIDISMKTLNVGMREKIILKDGEDPTQAMDSEITETKISLIETTLAILSLETMEEIPEQTFDLEVPGVPETLEALPLTEALVDRIQEILWVPGEAG